MNIFLVRVELYNSIAADFEILHEEMSKRGFSRSINNGGVNSFKLPPAEYLKEERGISTLGALNAAKAAASVTRREFSIIASKVDGAIECYNLDKL